MPKEKLDVVDRLMAFAESRGATLLELAFTWRLELTASEIDQISALVQKPS